MLRLLVLVLLLSPGAAFAQDAGTEPAVEPIEETPQPEVDLLTTRLQSMVVDYYVAIGSEASEDDLKQGVQSLQMMLLDGVSMSRIEAAIAAAVSLHTPGRRIPFQVAVPLRVRPADAVPRPDPAVAVDPAEPEERTGRTEESRAPAAEPEKTEERTAIEKRWVERQEQLRKRRNRLRLHLQWRDRTKEKRILLSLGIPLFVAGWAGTFSVAGATMTFGETLPSTGWTGAIPVAGPFVFGGLTDAQYPAVFAFAAFQGIGLALTIVALTKKIDWPYDRDPTALYLGRDRRTGKPKVTVHGGPMGVVGEF
jgi:hypothetical protein